VDILNILVSVAGWGAIFVAACWFAWLVFQELVWLATTDIRKAHSNDIRDLEAQNERNIQLIYAQQDYIYNKHQAEKRKAKRGKR